MRISTVQIFNIANTSMSEASEALVNTQEQLSTGQRVIDPSDDPVAATKILSLTTEMSTIEQYQKNINIAKNNLSLEETVLQSVNNLVTRIQELAVQAGNTATLSPSEYQSIANEVDSRLDELQNILNTQNSNGDFIFGGYKSKEEPFTGNPLTGFVYNGDDGQQFVKVANNTTVAMSDSGKSLFVDVESASSTFVTSTNPNNTSNPPISVTVGNVVDQELYDEFYPRDIAISFNADSAVVPAGKNFTAYDKNSGEILQENVPYLTGMDIEIEGISFRIIGEPVSGTAAEPANLAFSGAVAANDFSITNETFQLEVGGRIETLVLDQNITSFTDLVTNLNDAANGNAAKLANLGVTVDNSGFTMPEGINFSVKNESNSTVSGVLGGNISALGFEGTRTIDDAATAGALAQLGDQVFADSSEKQDILTTMARFSEAMKAFDGSDDARVVLTEIVNSTIANLANAQTSVAEVTSKIGARINTLESTESLQIDASLITQELLSDLRDVDYAEAATQLAAQTLVLEAAQSSFVRVSRLTLFSQL